MRQESKAQAEPWLSHRNDLDSRRLTYDIVPAIVVTKLGHHYATVRFVEVTNSHHTYDSLAAAFPAKEAPRTKKQTA